jgi:hypothetical protein
MVRIRGLFRRKLVAGSGTLVLAGIACFEVTRIQVWARSPTVAAGQEVNRLIDEQSRAVARNTHYLQQRDRFNQMLLRLSQKTPANPRQAEQIEGAIHTDRRALTHVERNILLSRIHLLSTLPGKVGRVRYLLNRMGRLAPDDVRMAVYIAFALKRQQSVLDQLIKILNQEQASTDQPGIG